MFGQSPSRSYAVIVAAGILTVATSAIPSLSGASIWGTRQWLYLLTMAVYLGYMGWVFLPLCDKRAFSGREKQVYFAVQITLLGVAEYLGKGMGTTWLAGMPLLGQIISWLDGASAARQRILWAGLLIGVDGGMKVWAIGWNQYVYWIGPMWGAYAFVVGFTWVAVENDRRRREMETLAQELRDANERLQDQAGRLEALTRDRERARVARELHDSLGHGLTALATQLEVAHAVPDKNSDKALHAISTARVLAQSALQDVRESVSTLRQTASLRPLTERLEELVKTAQGQGQEVVFEVQGTAVKLPPDTEQALFRATQEGLTNVRRHSGARRANVCIDFSDTSRIALVVRDDGRGRAASPVSSAGFGLVGLQERFALLGGRVDATNRVEGGFELRVEVPR